MQSSRPSLSCKIPVVKLVKLDYDDSSTTTRSRSNSPKESRKLVKKRNRMFEDAKSMFADNMDRAVYLAKQISLQSTKIKETMIVDERLKTNEQVVKMERNMQRFYDTLMDGVRSMKTRLAEDVAEWTTRYGGHRGLPSRGKNGRDYAGTPASNEKSADNSDNSFDGDVGRNKGANSKNESSDNSFFGDLGRNRGGSSKDKSLVNGDRRKSRKSSLRESVSRVVEDSDDESTSVVGDSEGKGLDNSLNDSKSVLVNDSDDVNSSKEDDGKPDVRRKSETTKSKTVVSDSDDERLCNSLDDSQNIVNGSDNESTITEDKSRSKLPEKAEKRRKSNEDSGASIDDNDKSSRRGSVKSYTKKRSVSNIYSSSSDDDNGKASSKMPEKVGKRKKIESNSSEEDDEPVSKEPDKVGEKKLSDSDDNSNLSDDGDKITSKRPEKTGKRKKMESIDNSAEEDDVPASKEPKKVDEKKLSDSNDNSDLSDDDGDKIASKRPEKAGKKKKCESNNNDKPPSKEPEKDGVKKISKSNENLAPSENDSDESPSIKPDKIRKSVSTDESVEDDKKSKKVDKKEKKKSESNENLAPKKTDKKKLPISNIYTSSSDEEGASKEEKEEKVETEDESVIKEENTNSNDSVDAGIKKELNDFAEKLMATSSDDDVMDNSDSESDLEVPEEKTSPKQKKLTKKRETKKVVKDEEDSDESKDKSKENEKDAAPKKSEKEEADKKESREMKRLMNLDSLERSHSKNAGSGSSSEDVKVKRKKPPVKKEKAESKKNMSDSNNTNSDGNDDDEEDDDDDDDDDLIDYKLPTIRREDNMNHKLLQGFFESTASESSEEEDDIAEKKSKKRRVYEKRGKRRIDDDDDDGSGSGASENAFTIKEKSWKKDKLLTAKLTDTDTSEDEKREARWRKKQEKAGCDESSDSDLFVGKKERKPKPKKIVLSDSDIVEIESESSDESSSSVEIIPKGKRRKKTSGSGSSSEDAKKKKKKRKRIIKGDSSSEDEDGEGEGDELNESNASQGKGGRRNIKKIMKDRDVAEATRSAAKDEEERRQRILERQKLYNSLYEGVEEKASKKVEKLVLDFDEKTKEPILSVDKGLVAMMKPHQAKGVKFMWDACFESVERIKTSKGGGCILAHCMGLGKTFQVISLVHTLLTHKELTKVERVMIVCPFSTILNWNSEFQKWMQHVEENDDLNVKYLVDKLNSSRAYRLKDWHEDGGVMIIGYDMFRNLSNKDSNKINKKLKKTFQTTLVDPGPDLIVCDEGHLLKNESTALSKAMTRIRTLRRIVLTGTPLQNNLAEYHCMVSFIKPNLLGTKNEFTNRFVNPINNGQFVDSTEHDCRVMKRRAHVLHKMLDGLVQRRDYNVLTPYLPPKQEYVLSIRLTDLQCQLYRQFLEQRGAIVKGTKITLFADFQQLSRVWTHPLTLKYNLERMLKKEEKENESDSAGSLKDFVVDGSSDEESASSSASSSEESKKSTTRLTRANKKDDAELHKMENDPEKRAAAEKASWWSGTVKQEHFDDMAVGSKLILLFELLKKCEDIGDKVLVFSQSLYSLDLIEHFLSEIDEATQNDSDDEDTKRLLGHKGSWTKGLDYFRLDGSTKGDNRLAHIKSFNKESNIRARLFLISTKAGGLGINLTAANRVVIFDVSWNPSHDIQSIFRIFRFGQRKPCYIYRFVAQGTMEEKVYERQISKLSLAQRVVDEQQVNRFFSQNELKQLYIFEPADEKNAPIPIVPKDRLMADLLQEHKKWIYKIFEHDSLLNHVEEEELDDEERKAAWEDYENEKKRGFGPPPQTPNIDFNIVKNALPAELYDKTVLTLTQKYPHKSIEEIHTQAVSIMTNAYIRNRNEELFKKQTERIQQQLRYKQQQQQRYQQPQQQQQNYQQRYQQPQQSYQQQQQRYQQQQSYQKQQQQQNYQKQQQQQRYQEFLRQQQQAYQSRMQGKYVPQPPPPPQANYRNMYPSTSNTTPLTSNQQAYNDYLKSIDIEEVD